jgi:hypothetical protein
MVRRYLKLLCSCAQRISGAGARGGDQPHPVTGVTGSL